MTNLDEIKYEWEIIKIPLVDLVEKYGVKFNSLKSHKSRDDKDSNPCSIGEIKKNITKIERWSKNTPPKWLS